MVVDGGEDAEGDDHEAAEGDEVVGGGQHGIAKEKVFEAEEIPADDELADEGGQSDGGGEEDADDGVAGQAAASADIGDAGADGHAEDDHDRRDPGPELAGRPVGRQESLEQQEADADAGEGAVGQGVAEESHAAADDERADGAAANADENQGEEGADVPDVGEETGLGELVVEVDDELVEPVRWDIHEQNQPVHRAPRLCRARRRKLYRMTTEWYPTSCGPHVQR